MSSSLHIGSVHKLNRLLAWKVFFREACCFCKNTGSWWSAEVRRDINLRCDYRKVKALLRAVFSVHGHCLVEFLLHHEQWWGHFPQSEELPSGVYGAQMAVSERGFCLQVQDPDQVTVRVFRYFSALISMDFYTHTVLNCCFNSHRYKQHLTEYIYLPKFQVNE